LKNFIQPTKGWIFAEFNHRLGGHMATAYTAERTLSAVFKEQNQVDQAIRRLLDRDVSRDHISVGGATLKPKPALRALSPRRTLSWVDSDRALHLVPCLDLF